MDEAALTGEELERASGYPAGAPRRRFLAARLWLRRLLSAYAGVAPRQLRLAYGDQGKPRLVEPATDLTFNQSHSGDLLLLAFGRGRELGIDVERTGRDVSWERVARRFFESRELEALQALPAPDRRAAFFRCWTRKEAFVKATGRGVTQGLRSFAVSLDPERAALTWIEDGDPADWGMADLEAGPGYAAAVCAAGRGWSLRCFEPRAGGLEHQHAMDPAQVHLELDLLHGRPGVMPVDPHPPGGPRRPRRTSSRKPHRGWTV